MDITTAWKESTQKIFWGVIVIAVAGIFSTIYDYLSYGVSLFEMASKIIPTDFLPGLGLALGGFKLTGGLAKTAVVAGYVFYLLGLSQFAAIQSNSLAALNIQKVRKAVIILICCFAASVLFGILLKIPFVGIIINLAIWAATLVSYFYMKNAFGVLMVNPAFSDQSKVGAQKLRFAAVCNIRLMLLPLMTLGAFLVIGLITFLLLQSGALEGAFKFAGIVGGIVLAVTIICALVFMVIALIYPFIGWYKIMKGGPGEDTLTDAAEIEQRLAAVPTADDQMKAIKEKSDAALASAKESMANIQKDMAPKLEKAKSWAAANKTVLGIGAGAVVVVALLAWLIPKIGTSKGIAFETYTVEDNIQAYVDIPVGDSEKAQNARKGLCEVIGMTHMADELGAPLEGASPREVIDDYNKRFSGYLDKFHRETGAPIAPSCQIFIESGFQNEACVVFEAAGAIYFNGSPDTYLRVVRLADGHVMKQEEMVNISADVLEPLVEKYNQDGMPVYLGDGFYFTPAANDSCMAVWPVGHGYGIAMIPLSEMEPYLTEAGRELFTAKAVEVPEKKQQALEADENQEAEAESVEDSGDALDMEVDDFVGGLLGALPIGDTKYVGEMAGFPIEMTIHKGDDGLRADYLNVKYSARMKLAGESLPADGGNITFFGDDAQNNRWFFDLEGDADNITGTGRSGNKNLPITLRRKN